MFEDLDIMAVLQDILGFFKDFFAKLKAFLAGFDPNYDTADGLFE